MVLLKGLVDYLLGGVYSAAGQFLSFLGPLLLLGFIVHLSALAVRAAAPGVFRAGFYRLLTAPGIILHEAAHLFFCLVFGHRVHEVRLFTLAPGEAPGRVVHSWNPRSIRQRAGNFFIGTGPIWVGAAAIFLLSRFMVAEDGLDIIRMAARWHPPGRFFPGPWDIFHSRIPAVFIDPFPYPAWRRVLFLYLALGIGSQMALSRSDFRGAADGLLVIFLLLLILNWAGILPGIIAPGFQAAFAVFNYWTVCLVALAAALNLMLAGLFFLAGLFRGIFRRR